MANERLDDRQVHIWLADPATAPWHNLATMLGDEERGRMDKFRFAKDRQAYLTAHVLVRTVLSKYEDRTPGEWKFTTNAYGRPDVDPDLDSRLNFNLSHTDGLVACAVTTDHQVGVDVEASDRALEVEDVVDRYLSPEEMSVLRSLPQDQRRLRFFTYWTLKEAYIKARGLGLSIPLDQFTVKVTADTPITIAFGREMVDDAALWRFHSSWPTDRHSLGVAVKTTGEDVQFTVRTAAIGTS